MGVFGYLDAGSGSMLVGAVAAAGAGVAVAAKVGWKRVTGVFGKKGAEPDEDAVDGDTAQVTDEVESAPVADAD
jgi:hypothetical protein